MITKYVELFAYCDEPHGECQNAIIPAWGEGWDISHNGGWQEYVKQLRAAGWKIKGNAAICPKCAEVSVNERLSEQ